MYVCMRRINNKMYFMTFAQKFAAKMRVLHKILVRTWNYNVLDIFQY